MSDMAVGAVALPRAQPLDVRTDATSFALRLRTRLALVALGDGLGGLAGSLLAQQLALGYMPALRWDFVARCVSFSGIWLVSLLLVDGYSMEMPVDRRHTIAAGLKAIPVVAAASVVTNLLGVERITLPGLLLLLIISGTIVVNTRLLLSMLITQPLYARVLLLGSSPEKVQQMVSVLESASTHYRVVGSLVADQTTVTPGGSGLNGNKSAETVDFGIASEMDLEAARGLVEACIASGIKVVTLSSLIERFHARVPLTEVTTRWLVDARGSRGSDMTYLVLRRLLDIVLAGTLGIVLLPLILLAIVVIKLDSPGPALLRQRRLGQYGREFSMLKLRSMRADAEAHGPSWAQIDDDRVTRIGRVLRSTHLDEVPQLLNVIHGDMTLVGPRPERPEFYELLELNLPHFRFRLLAKPGLSGLAQIECGYAASIREATLKLEHDLYYVKRQSLHLDLEIMFLTIFYMFKLRGR